jgi:hypothetical protein
MQKRLAPKYQSGPRCDRLGRGGMAGFCPEMLILEAGWRG